MQARTEAVQPSYLDYPLLISTLILVALGLTMVFISSTVMAQAQYQDPYFFVKRQFVYALLGATIVAAGWFVDYHHYQRWRYWLLLLALVGLLLVFVPGVGIKVRGAARWLRLGPVTVQPSEFAKLAMVIFLASSLARKQEKMKYFAIGFLPHLILAGIFVALIGKEPDFGTAMTMFGIVLIMLLVGGTRLTYILMSAGLTLPTAIYLVIRDPRKFSRILSFLDPWKYGQDVGYQLKQSLLAIGAGGLLGMGPGQSRAKLFYLPDAHTDFILAIFCEELGFIGVAGVIALFAFLVYRGLTIALRAPDAFGSYLALGLTLLIGLPACINMGVVSGLLPTKGLSLPFLSYGGSSLLVNLMAIGILLNISSQIKRPGRGAKAPPRKATGQEIL